MSEAAPEPIGDVALVHAHLIAAAAAGHSLTYSELLERLGSSFSRPKMRALCVTLGVVDREAAARGEPELAVLVVRQSDGLPGQGWWVAGGASDHGYTGAWDGARAATFVRKLQAAAFAYWAARSP
ncbi:MAG: ribose-phosphate pyrophosphokinase [Sphingomicrobium sp.]